MNDADDPVTDADLSSADEHRRLIDLARHQAQRCLLRMPTPAGRWVADTGDPFDMPGDMVEGYHLIEELHRGGQGMVFRGVQLSTDRSVAVKILPLGEFATRAERLRFEREVEILSQLTAPGIVRIIDSGVASGRWWFSMEFVDGVPLDSYARRLRCEPDARPRVIALCAAVADAVNAAHLHGVIHRDLKPRNILVDRNGQPHVLDFGLARQELNGIGDHTSTMTEAGQFVGSLPWASPEQVSGAGTPVDLRADIYGLGVILFQLLTDRFPYRVIGPAHEVVRAITSAEPTSPASFDASIDDDLATIVLKCLNKEASRRYQSAGDLARDLRHYLAGDPIEAKRDSLSYLWRRRLRRHRVAAGAVFSFILMLAGAATVTAMLWQNAAAERDRAIDAELAQERLKQRAEREVRKTAEVNRFLQTVIGAADPGRTQGHELTLREMMDTTRRQLDAGQLAEEPDLEAAVRGSIAQVLAALGQLDDASAQHEQALVIRERVHGGDHRDVAESLVQWSEVLGRQGRRDEALTMAQRGLDIIRRVHNGDHRDVVECLRRVAWAHVGVTRLTEAEARMAEAVAMLERLVGPDDVALLQLRLDQTVMSHSGSSVRATAEILDRLHDSLGPLHPDVLTAMKMLGGMLQMNGDLQSAEDWYRKSLIATEDVYGPTHPRAIEAHMTLAQLLAQRGDLRGAFTMLLDVRAQAEVAHGTRGFGYAQFLNVLGGLAGQLRDDTHAEASHALALEIFRALRRDQSGEGARARIALAQVCLRRDELVQAEVLLNECLAIDQSVVAPSHWMRGQAHSMLGQIRLKQRAFAASEALLLQAHRELAALGPRYEPMRDAAARTLVRLYEAWDTAAPELGKGAEADAWRKRASVENTP